MQDLYSTIVILILDWAPRQASSQKALLDQYLKPESKSTKAINVRLKDLIDQKIRLEKRLRRN